jgi:hypothetical protein
MSDRRSIEKPTAAVDKFGDGRPGIAFHVNGRLGCRRAGENFATGAHRASHAAANRSPRRVPAVRAAALPHICCKECRNVDRRGAGSSA